MRPTPWLRAASLLTLLFAAGHTFGGTQAWSPVGETAVLRSMREFRFDASGTSRSYLEFYLGFGFIISVYFLLQAVLLWQLATLAAADPARARPLVGSLFVATVAIAALSWRFIFLMPVVFGVLIAVCIAVAYRAAGAGSTPRAS